MGADAPHTVAGVRSAKHHLCMRHVPAGHPGAGRTIAQGRKTRPVAAASLAGGRMESRSSGVKGTCRRSSCFALLNSAQNHYLFFF